MLRWQIRRDGRRRWQPVSVPGCWEDAGFPVTDPGPYWYRTMIPAHRSAGQRLWLDFGAASYHCAVSVDGQEIGSHTGLWDPFEVEIPGVYAPGKRAEMLVRVEKPASLTAGPDSPAVPGRFPLRQTLSGFLPYVWGHAFGGLWQEVQVRVTGPRRRSTCTPTAQPAAGYASAVSARLWPMRLMPLTRPGNCWSTSLSRPDRAWSGQETCPTHNPGRPPPQRFTTSC